MYEEFYREDQANEVEELTKEIQQRINQMKQNELKSLIFRLCVPCVFFDKTKIVEQPNKDDVIIEVLQTDSFLTVSEKAKKFIKGYDQYLSIKVKQKKYFDIIGKWNEVILSYVTEKMGIELFQVSFYDSKINQRVFTFYKYDDEES